MKHYYCLLTAVAVLLWAATNAQQLFHSNTIALQTQQLINTKQQLYKDITTTTPPLSYYLTGLFLIALPLQTAILVEYILLSAVILLLVLAVATDIVKARQAKEALTYFPIMVYVLLQVFVGWEDISSMLGTAIVLLTSLLLFRYYDKMSSKNSAALGIIPMGVCLGLLVACRQDMASYMWGLFFWAMFWAGMADVEGLHLSLLQRATKGLRQGLLLTLVMLLTAGINLAYAVWQAGWGVLWQLGPAALKSKSIQLLLPTSFEAMLFYLPLVLAVLSLVVLIVHNRKRRIKANTPLFWKEMLLINLTLNTFNYSLLGRGIDNCLPATLCAALLVFNVASAFAKPACSAEL